MVQPTGPARARRAFPAAMPPPPAARAPPPSQARAALVAAAPDRAEMAVPVEAVPKVVATAMATDGPKAASPTPAVAPAKPVPLPIAADFAAVDGVERIDSRVADSALRRLEVDNRGLDSIDRRYLNCVAQNFGGGPVGVETLAAAISEQRDMIEDVIEPYLIQQGFLQRTPRGRLLTESAFRQLGLTPPRLGTPDLLIGIDGQEAGPP